MTRFVLEKGSLADKICCRCSPSDSFILFYFFIVKQIFIRANGWYILFCAFGEEEFSVATMSVTAQSIVKQSLLYDARLGGARKALAASVVGKRADAVFVPAAYLPEPQRLLPGCGDT